MLIDQLSDDQKPFQMNYEYYPNVGFTLGSQIQLVESAKEPKVGKQVVGAWPWRQWLIAVWPCFFFVQSTGRSHVGWSSLYEIHHFS